MTVAPTEAIAALDIGSTKVRCLIAALDDDGVPRIVGFGSHVSGGMRAGAVIDMGSLEHSVRAAVDAAQAMAGCRVTSAWINVSRVQLASGTVKVEVPINGRPVNETDLRRLHDLGRAHYDAPGRELLHVIPMGYTIDGNEGITDPNGMFGIRLGMAMHVISAAVGPVRNLAAAVNLDVEGRVASPYASGFGCLVEEEREAGVTCIDMGGDTTSIAVFQGGKLAHLDVIPIGGQHITDDILRRLSTEPVYAEKLKTLYGAAISAPEDEHEMLKVPLLGDRQAVNMVTRSQLIQIIRTRQEEAFELVRSHLEQGDLAKGPRHRVVLTGGASQLLGVRDLAVQVLDAQVRLGLPIHFTGLPEAASGAAFSTCAGLIRYAALDRPTHRMPQDGGRAA